MRLYSPIYAEDGILQPGTFPGGDVTKLGKIGDCRAGIVRSTNPVASASEPARDIAATEKRTRAARNTWVGSKLKSYYEVLVRKFARAGQSELENYLAASQNLADLEDRIRRYQRRQQSRYY